MMDSLMFAPGVDPEIHVFSTILFIVDDKFS